MLPRPAAGDPRYRPGVAEAVYWLVTVATAAQPIAEILTAPRRARGRAAHRRRRPGTDRRRGPVRRQHLVANPHAADGPPLTPFRSHFWIYDVAHSGIRRFAAH
jgi:hypothetical protein